MLLSTGIAGVLNFSGNSNPKAREGLKSVVKSVILSGGWLQPIQAGVRPAGRGSLFWGDGTEVSDAGSGFDLWHFLPQSSEKLGHQSCDLGPAQPLAKPVC
jgi:hypothetical protein